MLIKIIVAVAPNKIIGKDGKIPWHLPEDLKFFKKVTTNHAVVMGRKTHESIGKPLPNRRNIVITRQTDYKREDVDIVHSLESALSLCRARNEQEVFIIGGEQVYKEALLVADELYITDVDLPVVGDTYFPEINEDVWLKAGWVDASFPLANRFIRKAI